MFEVPTMRKRPTGYERNKFLNGAQKPAHALSSPGRDLDRENNTPSPTHTEFP